MLIYGLYIGTAYPEAVLTSKAYVDNKVPAYASGGSPSLLTDTTTTGTIAKRAIFTDGTTYVAGTHATQIPTMGAVMSAISGGTTALPWATAEQSATGAYNTTFADSGTNVWPTADADKVVKGQTFANAMATKQNKIGVEDDELILGQQRVTGMRAVLAPTDTAGIVNQIGLWDADGGDPESWDLDSAYGDADERQLITRSIPTVGAVATGLNSLKDQIDDIDIPDISNLQTKIPKHAANAADSLLTDSTTTGTVQKRAIFNDTAANYNASTQSTQIPTMGAVMSAISGGTTALPWATAEQNATGAYSTTFADSGTNVWPTADADKVVKGQTFANAMATKQSKIPASTDGYLVTHSGTEGTFGTPKRVVEILGDDPLGDPIPTVGAVVSAFYTKFPASGGTDKVVTLGSMAGAPTSRNIVTTLTNGGTNIPTDGAVYSAVDAKQDKATCTMTKPGDSTVCYAYTFANVQSADIPRKNISEFEPELKK